ncbi:hypothetical protein Tco_1001672 [Tanacetum coccineum]
MSSYNASSAVTYTSISSDSNGPSSWGIPLVNAGELPEIDPYEQLMERSGPAISGTVSLRGDLRSAARERG